MAELLLYLVVSTVLVGLVHCLHGLSKYSRRSAPSLTIENDRRGGEVLRCRPRSLPAFLVSKHSCHHLEVLLELLQAASSLVLQNESSQFVKFILQYAILLGQPVVAAQQLQKQRRLGCETAFVKIQPHGQG